MCLSLWSPCSKKLWALLKRWQSAILPLGVRPYHDLTYHLIIHLIVESFRGFLLKIFAKQNMCSTERQLRSQRRIDDLPMSPNTLIHPEKVSTIILSGGGFLHCSSFSSKTDVNELLRSDGHWCLHMSELQICLKPFDIRIESLPWFTRLREIFEYLPLGIDENRC